jgi:hypothetical protein
MINVAIKTNISMNAIVPKSYAANSFIGEKAFKGNRKRNHKQNFNIKKKKKFLVLSNENFG